MIVELLIALLDHTWYTESVCLPHTDPEADDLELLQEAEHLFFRHHSPLEDKVALVAIHHIHYADDDEENI